MAALQRHPSLRFSVFEVAAGIGLETIALDGNFDPIIEEDEREPSSANKQRQTQSSDELTDSSFPLTPPSSNDALFTTQPLALGQKHPEERPRFIERFPSPSPELKSTTPTPRTPPGKLRKTYTPAAGTPVLEPLRLDYGTDADRDRFKRRENGKKKDRDDEKEKRHIQTDVDEEKKLLGGLLRFRTRSKERKAAAKQAVQQVAPIPLPETMPVKPHTPPPLPIAERFGRPMDDISFRPKPRESGSSHGGTTSVGHGSSTGHADSSESHEPYIRPRDRSSRYERPHPVWRTGPSTLGNGGLASARGAIVDAPLPKEIHAYPPGQTIFDRDPVKADLQVKASAKPEESKSPAVDMDMVNRYYGFMPTETQTQTSPIVASIPSPQSRSALAQALAPIETKAVPSEGALRPSPSPMAPLPASPSPYIVPSPNPAQSEFGAQARAKRGRINVSPAMEPGLVHPKRMMGAFNPPPTPPPTTELPPIPTDATSPQSPSRLGAQRPLGSPQPLPPPSAGLRPGPPTSPLGMRTSSPSLRPEPSRLSPYPERPGTAPQEGGPPARSASPMLRGRAPAFPTRPITPTRPPPASQQQQQQQRPVSPPHVRFQQRPAPSPNPGSGFLINRKPDYDITGPNRNRTASLDENEPATRVPGQRQPFIQQKAVFPSRADDSLTQQKQSELPYGSRSPPPTRKRSIRKAGANQSGYDSDDSRYSRHSRDTYYGRDTFYYDDQNMPPLPGAGDNAPPLPRRDLGNLEQERQAGRERLVRMLASREI